MKINSLLFLFLLTVSCSQPENRIDLTGKWQFTTDSTNWSGSILLPGSMTSNGLGEDININTPWTGSINDDSYLKMNIMQNIGTPITSKYLFGCNP